MLLPQANDLASCSTSAGFQFVVAGGWHSALSGVLASIVFVAIVFVLTNDPQAEDHRHARGPSLRILFVTFFVFLVASFLWATVAGFPSTITDSASGDRVAVAVQPVLAVPAAWLLSEGVVLLFFAISSLVYAYEHHRDPSAGVSTTAIRCFRLIAWLAAVEVWIAIETATRSLAGRGWWYSPTGVAIVTLLSVPFLFADRILARGDYERIADAESFHTKLAGVSFEGRQEVVARLTPGTPLRVVRQPDNEFDPNAIAILDPHGDQVGFLNRRLSGVLAKSVDAGVEYDVEVTDVTGGGEGRSLGVNVLLTRRDVVEGAEEIAAEREQCRAALVALPPHELDDELVRRFIGERSLHAAQVESLAALAQGESTLAVMATGRGKSLIFHLHAARIALREGAASVFVYPLRALVADQAFHLAEAFGGVGLEVRVVTGETSQGDRDSAFAQIAAGELDVILTTPEFLHFHHRRFVETGRVRFVVVDEAHHVGLSRAGNRPAYARLGEALENLGSPVVLAVTATASDEVATQIRSSLGITRVVLDPTVRDNLIVEDRRGGADKDAYLLALAARGEKMVVYVNSRDASVRLARTFRKRLPEMAFRTAFYNGGLSRQVRHAVERAFRSGEVNIVVATSAFGEGVNIPDIRHVALYHLPFNDVEFNQMSGRAGRDGAASRVHLLFGEKDARINERILSSLAPQRDDLVALYRVLRELAGSEGPQFEITNAELAQRCAKVRPGCGLDDRSVSTGLGVFRDLRFVESEGHGAYRRLTFLPGEGRVDLESSVRYAEGIDEIADFQMFRTWALSATADELLERFNRPILPSI